MKINKYFLILLTLVVAVGLIYSPTSAKEPGKAKLAKTEVASSKRIDVNQIDMWVLNNGVFGSNPLTGQSGLYYPKGQTAKTIIYTAGLWVVGKIGTDVRSGAADYSTEFQPGMIKADGTPDSPTAPQYRVYKIKKGDSASPSSANYNVDYAEWPADQGAPINQDGTPKMIGDQVLFTVYNDYADHANVWQKQPIGLEVQETLWGYDQTGPLGNTIFIRFVFTNKGQNALTDTYVGIFSDPDLGDANDDYVACDTTLSLGYVYNGDGYDATYGVEVPACGFDFFQGPIVPESGSTVTMPDGTVLTDMKMLPMTAFVMYINGSTTYSDPDLQSAEGALQAYYYLQGYVWDGSPFIDPITGLESKFVNYGDPVAGTGWLPQSVTPPKDMRMVLSSGPFDLPVNTPKEVVTGIIVGPGSDNLNSISVLKYYDKAAQIAYDQNFNVASPPPQPLVKTTQLDETIVLTWDEAAVNFSQLGYDFEGYNVYQGASSSGPWKKVATFDKVNGITTITDFAFNREANSLLQQPVQTGSDAGINFKIEITNDNINNVPLVNGKQYYFAVTGYAYNPEGVPKTLENSPATIVAIPQKPVLDTQYNATLLEELPVTVTGPKNDGIITPIVVIPGEITGHDYQVTFYTIGPDTDLTWVWKLTDKTLNTDVLKDRLNRSYDEEYPVADGMQVKVSGPTLAEYGINLNAGSGGWSYTGSRYITNVNAGLEAFGGGLGIGENFFGSNLTPMDYVNVRIDFWNQAHNQADPVAYPWTKAYVYHRDKGYTFQGIGTFPGAAYDIEDPAHPRRLNISFVEDARPGQGLADMFWNPIAAEATGAPNGGREYLFIMRSNYADGAPLYGDDNNGTGRGSNADVLYAIWPAARAGHNADEEFKFTIYCNHPVSTDNVFAWSTASYLTTVDNSIAKKRIAEVNVFPNPYFGSNTAETDFFTQFVTFSNLPPKCTIRIFSLSGGHVRTLEHNADSPFERWYLRNEDEIPVGSGIFLAFIDIPNVGEKVLKIAVINREPRYRHF